MASFIDLENEDLIAEDENELFGHDVEGDYNADADNEPNEAQANDQDEDENAAENATKVAPKKRVVKNPQPKLDADKLKGPRGLMIMEEWFKDIKFKGKGHEKEDLDNVMCRLEQWTHRLFPKFTFDDCLARIEKLGHKKPVNNYVRRIRLDMEENYSAAVMNVDEDEPVEETDAFDALLDENSQRTPTETISAPTLTNEQKERMLRNRLLAEERRQARARERAEAERLANQPSEMENVAEASSSEMLADTNIEDQDQGGCSSHDLESSIDNITNMT